jgi:hypothetical protein
MVDTKGPLSDILVKEKSFLFTVFLSNYIAFGEHMIDIKIIQEHNQQLFDLYIFPFYHQLSDVQLRSRPDARFNSISWNLWHIARAEDVGINRLVMHRPQLLDQGGWFQRLEVPFRHIGTGMTKDEVDVLSVDIDLSALHDYHRTVHACTQNVFDQFEHSILNERLDAALLQSVLHDGEMLHPAASFVYEVYLDRTKAWLALHLSLNHPWYHLGEIMAIRSILTSR